MKASDIKAYLDSLNTGWVYENTVDTFKSGDPDSELTGVAVGWMSYFRALKHAVKLNCNLFITHEPTFYAHSDNDPTVFKYESLNLKRKFIEENKIIILRCHDLWDQYRPIGIPDSWAELLGFIDPIITDSFYRVFDRTLTKAVDVARDVARRTRKFGQPGVQLIGPPEKMVRRIAIGTGAITPYRIMLDRFQPDLIIATDDGFTYWKDGAMAIDMDIPVIVVNHAVSEVHGMERLAERLAEVFPSLQVHPIRQMCMYHLVDEHF